MADSIRPAIRPRHLRFILISVLSLTSALARAGNAPPNEEQAPDLKVERPWIDASMQRGIHTDADTGRKFFTGYSYETLYDWDQYFEGIVQLHMGWKPDYIVNGETIFLDNQREDGFIPRSKSRNSSRYPEESSEMVKPFLAQIAVLVARSTGRMDWLDENYYQRMRKYLVYWLVKLSKDGGELSYWRSAPHTGMDTQIERAGYWRADFCDGVDLNSFLYRECLAFALVADTKGHPDDAVFFRRQAERKKEAILGKMWNEKDGMFYDIDNRTGKQMRVKSIATFAPMWAEIATPAQAKRLVEEHLTNTKEFWRAFPISAYAATEPGYREQRDPRVDIGCLWRADTWIPTNYYIFHALHHYGYHVLAGKLAEITCRKVRQIGVREYYTSDSCRGQGLNPFWGWSLLAYFMPWEEAQMVDPTDLNLHAPLPTP